MLYVALLSLLLTVIDVLPHNTPERITRHIIQFLVPVMQSMTVEPALRRRAGLALAQLGWILDDVDDMVRIPSGKFLYGKDKREKEVTYTYWISKYPVTNLQYSRFIANGGYKNKLYWSDKGWQWLQSKYLGYELHKVTHFEFSSQNFPVVNVTWYEADAYCRWLNTKDKKTKDYKIRLPTEWEWERTARGTDGRQYPWGDEFMIGMANTEDIDPANYGILTTSVNTFAKGISPTGAWDMSGNVWEWTTSWYDRFQTFRVLRGGAWNQLGIFARCFARNWLTPDTRANSGFRIVFSNDLGF